MYIDRFEKNAFSESKGKPKQANFKRQTSRATVKNEILSTKFAELYAAFVFHPWLKTQEQEKNEPSPKLFY